MLKSFTKILEINIRN